MKSKNALILLLLILINLSTYAQIAKQTVRGRVIDKDSEAPLTGALITATFNTKKTYSTSDVDGYFSFKIPIGRCDISITYMGYKPQEIRSLMTYAGKETVLNVTLEENVAQIESVVVRGGQKKQGAIGEMATASVRILSPEEANRYAGAWADPARMASNLAGVASANDSRNDIVIRGNSPAGVQWRLDGFVIANPNHYGAMGGSGGVIGMINNNQLRSSDFYTGAFPAEYGDLTAGLFDLRLRTGNSQKGQYMAAVGFNGLEFGAEGGFSKKSKASYLINARYSLLESLEWIGVKIDAAQGGTPKYWDVSAKFDFPMKNSNLSFVFLPGQSKIAFCPDMTDTEEWMPGDFGESVDMRGEQYFAGANYTYRFNDNSRLENRFSYQTARYMMESRSVGFMNETDTPFYSDNSSEDRITYSAKHIQKFNAKNTLNSGFSADLFLTSLASSVSIDNNMEPIYNVTGRQSVLLGAFSQWQHKISNAVSILPGFHAQYYTLGNDISIEPRLGFQWKTNKNLTLGASSGLYSQIQSRQVYFYQKEGQTLNENLQMTHSWQTAVSAEYMLTPSLRFKTEVYYQYLYGVPVSAEIPQESALNQGDGFANVGNFSGLANQGTGTNYGVEFTLEKFFDKNFYFLITASLYESKYRGYDQVLRDTKFNGNFALNVLGGYEFKLGKRTSMSINAKVAWMGNKRYTPRSTTDGEFGFQYDYTQAYAFQLPDYFRVDLNANLKTDFKGVSVEYFFELDNITNQKNIWIQYYDQNHGKDRYYYQQGFMPMGGMRIYF